MLNLISTTTYKIGIEIECLLGKTKQANRQPRRHDYNLIQEGMAQSLKLQGSSEKVIVRDGDKAIRPKYESWALTKDSSIKGRNGQVEVEIVSPILEYGFSRNANWRNSTNQIFGSLRGFNIETNETCATHVHLSPILEPWIMKSFRKLGCCILFFDPAMAALYPKHPQQKVYAKANGVEHPVFKAQDLSSTKGLQICFKEIYKTKTELDFIALMNPGKESAVPGHPYNPCDPYDRYYGWNFTNLATEDRRTVEFRHPPGVTRSADCQTWVDLAVVFVTAATNVSNTNDLFKRYRNRDVHDLKQFLETALPKGSSAKSHFGNLFNDFGGNINVERTQRQLCG